MTDSSRSWIKSRRLRKLPPLNVRLHDVHASEEGDGFRGIIDQNGVRVIFEINLALTDATTIKLCVCMYVCNNNEFTIKHKSITRYVNPAVPQMKKNKKCTSATNFPYAQRNDVIH